MSMSQRSKACVAAVKREQRPDGRTKCAGGWGRFRDDAATLSATADALRVLDLGAEQLNPPETFAVQQFVIRHLQIQLSSDHPDDVYTHQLSGALRIDHELIRVGKGPARHDAAFRGLLAEARTPLLGVLRDAESGGWRPRPGKDPDIVSTYHGVWAMQVLRELLEGEAEPDEQLVRKVERARAEGHRYLIAQSQHRAPNGKAHRKWSQAPGLEPSIAATSLAVTSLAQGNETARIAAAEGAEWLREQLPRRDRPGDIYRVHWEAMLGTGEAIYYPITAMGALAYVEAAPHLGHPPVPSFIAEAMAELDAMWIEETAAWDRDHGEGRQGFIGTSRTILTLHRAVTTHGDWDVIIRECPRRQPRKRRVEKPTEPTLHRAKLTSTGIEFEHHGPRLLRVRPSQLRLVRALHSVGNDLVSLEDAAALYRDHGGNRVQPTTIRTYVEQLRRELNAQAETSIWAELGYPIDTEGTGYVRACWTLD